MPQTGQPPLRLLTFTTLYPNAAQPTHGVFVENRIRHLVASGQATTEVVAPIPAYPVVGRFLSGYGDLKAPDSEMRHGIRVHHPRYPLVPKISMTAAPLPLYLAARRRIEALSKAGLAFDLIDAHYFYPDGVAAVMLGRHFGKPVTITARGTDINLIPRYFCARRMIKWAAERAEGMITVCAALKDELVALGVSPERVRVLRNGVDLAAFRMLDRSAIRKRLGIEGPTLLSVGHLIERKAHDLVIQALEYLPDWSLLIAGDGPEEGKLRALAARPGVANRVRFLGRLAHDRLAETYNAADLLILASSREGWANVLLEAMACGTPVAASNVWGTPEVVAAPAAGALFAERTPAAIAAAVKTVVDRRIDRAATRAYAEQFSWDATTEGQIDLFRGILRGARGHEADSAKERNP